MNKTLAKLCYHLMLESGLVGNLGNSFSFRVCSECVCVCGRGRGGEGGGERKKGGTGRGSNLPLTVSIFLGTFCER